MQLLRAKITIIVFLCACEVPCPKNYFQNVTNYTINPVTHMASGWKLDSDVGFFAALNEIDNRLSKMEECILKLSREITNIDPNWQCIRPLPTSRFVYTCLIIKVTKPVYSSCSSWEHLEAKAPDQYCRDKGLEPTEECPCLWRTATQDDYTLVTPSALYLWEFIRIYTGCNNYWYSPFSSCALY